MTPSSVLHTILSHTSWPPALQETLVRVFYVTLMTDILI